MANIVVVGVDGSDSALHAARCAAEMAEALGATLHIVTAVNGRPSKSSRRGRGRVR